jgi:hypothetical protein
MKIATYLLLVVALLYIPSVNAQKLNHPQQQSLKDTVAAYFNEIKVVTAEHKNVWNDDLYAPILLVRPDSREVYANSRDTAGVLKHDGTIFTGVLPTNVNIANTSIHWNGLNWAMVMLPLPEDRNERLCLLSHELFHRAQPHLGFKPFDPINNHLDQKNGRVYLRLELEALRAALLAGSTDEVNKHLTNALTFRTYRRTLYPGADSTENSLELNEGIAEYTGTIVSGWDKQQRQSHFVKSINDFLTNPTFVRSFAYQTIPLYGYFLRSINKTWNKSITSGTDLTAYIQRMFNVQLPHDLQSVAMALADQYGGQTIIAEETKRESIISRAITACKNKFIEGPHLEIPLRNMNISFDTRNILPIENVGTMYPNLRITDDWGILTVTKGALMSPTWNKVSVTTPSQFGKDEVLGDGWTLELKPDFVVQKEGTSDNYVLRKR